MKLLNGSELALEVWDYFYLRRYPRENEKKAWSRIECATIRIRESEQLMKDTYPAPVRFRNAKRVRRAAREIVGQVAKLETVPEPWVAEAVAALELWADTVMAETRDESRERPLH